jgi:hypothetical protein
MYFMNGTYERFDTASTLPVLGAGRHGPAPIIAAQTGPANAIRGRSITVLADLENLLYSARQLGYLLSLPGLARWLRESTCRCVLHGFLSIEPDQVDEVLLSLNADDWTIHVNPIEVIRTHKGLERQANADSQMLLWAGHLAGRTPDGAVLVVATGDGSLGNSIARFAHDLKNPREVVTLSLAGSTSQRLEAARNPLIAANLEIGLDLLACAPRSCGPYPRWRI